MFVVGDVSELFQCTIDLLPFYYTIDNHKRVFIHLNTILYHSYWFIVRLTK